MKELIIIRHGEATHLTLGLTGGWTDSTLTSVGEEQAHLSGLRVAQLWGDRPFGFYASDQRRAVQTAQIIAEVLDCEPQYNRGLRELNNGAAAGLDIETAAGIAQPPTEPALDWVQYKGAESWRTMIQRISACMDEIAARGDETCLIVAHGNCSRGIIHWWLGLGEKAWAETDFNLDPASITQLDLSPWGQRRIAKLNETAHLGKLERWE